MKYALVQGNRICQFASTADGCFPVAPDLQWIQVADGTTTNDTYVNGAVVTYVAPVVSTVPMEISDRQFFQQLAIMNVITQADALAAVKTGTLPAPLQALINGLPADEQFGATMILSGATTYYRNNPLTIAFGTAYGWTSAQIDAFFTAAALL